MRRNAPRLLAGLLSGIVILTLWFGGALDTLEWKSRDWRQRVFADRSGLSGEVAILLIDQASLDFMEKEEGIPWPWPRSLYIPAIEYCRKAGAKGVIFDMLFTESSMYGVGDDAELGEVIGAGGVVLPLLAHGNRDGLLSTGGYRPPLTDDGSGVYVEYTALTLPVPALRENAAGLGNVNFLPDTDGVFRSVPPLFRNGANALLTLPFAAFAHLEGETIRFEEGELFAGGREIPLDRDGRLLVHFRGPAGTIPSWSMASAIQSFVREESGEEVSLPKDLLDGRYVFIGAGAPGLLDLRPTPMSPVYPGVEIHATVLDNLLAGDFLAEVPTAIDVIRCFLPAVFLAFLLGIIRSAWKGALLLPLFAVLLVIGPVIAYHFDRQALIVPPLLSVLLTFLSVQTIQYATEGRKKRFLKHAFRHYLSPQVIDEIVKDPDRLKLGGERKELSIFFSDIESFTSISERLEPEQLTALLNRYLTEMTDIIQEEGGTVDKYEGDAIIAFWNAPLDQPDHPARAIRAGIRCLQRLDRINPDLAKSAGSPLRIRIGIHTGPVVVGNMGSRDRFDYTVIGDAANLASRLEGLGKLFRSSILVSGEALKGAGDRVVAREVGRVRVVGRSAPTVVFQPYAREGEPPIFPWMSGGDAVFQDGLHAYCSGEIEKARVLFDSLPDDPTATVYAERCRKLSGVTLPLDWEGVWEMQTK